MNGDRSSENCSVAVETWTHFSQGRWLQLLWAAPSELLGFSNQIRRSSFDSMWLELHTGRQTKKTPSFILAQWLWAQLKIPLLRGSVPGRMLARDAWWDVARYVSAGERFTTAACMWPWDSPGWWRVDEQAPGHGSCDLCVAGRIGPGYDAGWEGCSTRGSGGSRNMLRPALNK